MSFNSGSGWAMPPLPPGPGATGEEVQRERRKLAADLGITLPPFADESEDEHDDDADTDDGVR